MYKLDWTCMSLDWSRKLRNLEKTLAATRRACKLICPRKINPDVPRAGPVPLLCDKLVSRFAQMLLMKNKELQ